MVLLALGITFPSIIASVIPVRLLCVLALTLMLAACLGVARRAPIGLAVTVAITLATFAIVSVASQLAAESGVPVLSTNIQRLFLVTPLAFAAGYFLEKRGRGEYFLRVFLWVAGSAAVLAIAEAVLGFSVLGRQELFLSLAREGSLRAIVGSEQALVLGTLLAIAIPTCVLLSRRYQLISVLTLLGGIYATNSRGPLILGVVLAILVLVPSLQRVTRARSRWVLLVVVGVVAIIALSSASTYSQQIPGATGTEYSANYRLAIYATLPELITTAPLGYGLGAFPAGVWLVSSEAYGVVDLVDTLDSELVYSAFTFGVVGVAAVIFALIVAVRALRGSGVVGLAALTISILGFSVALHAWDSLGTLWVLLTGMCCAAGGRRALSLVTGSKESVKRVVA